MLIVTYLLQCRQFVQCLRRGCVIISQVPQLNSQEGRGTWLCDYSLAFLLSLQVEIQFIYLFVCPSSLQILFLIQTLSSRNLHPSTLVTQPLQRYPMQCLSSMPPMPASQLVPLPSQLVPQWFHLGWSYVSTWHFFGWCKVIQILCRIFCQKFPKEENTTQLYCCS